MKKNIIIVESDLIIQELHKHYIESLGHQVSKCFENGTDLIQYLKNNSADLIITDIEISGLIDGIEMTKRIQENQSIPVVYTTSKTDDYNYKRAVNTNMRGFLHKPIILNDLKEIIESLHIITDSILYAERIQKAIFPDRQEIHKIFINSLYIYRPKDIISGDFSILIPRKKHDDIIGGIGDCTGHGVPAALLSVLCHEILTNNIKKNKELKTIINKLNTSIIRNLSSYNSENKLYDGLDLILFRVVPKQSIIEISGIKRPFIHFNNKNKTISYYNLKGNSIGNPFNNIEEIPFYSLEYSEDDYFYFFSDGVTDQFGGNKGKKLMKKGLIDFLTHLSSFPKPDREIELDIFLRKWQGNLEQTDDMIFMGISPCNVNIPYIYKKQKDSI